MVEYACPHNGAVICAHHKCEFCGWDPKVEAQRKKIILGEKDLYRVPFTGYCEVWANTPEEAAEKADDLHKHFFAHYEYGEPKCIDKEEKDE